MVATALAGTVTAAAAARWGEVHAGLCGVHPKPLLARLTYENNSALTNNPIVNNDDNIEFPNDELVDDAKRVDELLNEEVMISLSTNRGDDFGDFEAPHPRRRCVQTR